MLTKLLARMRESVDGHAALEMLTLRSLFERLTMSDMAATLRDLLGSGLIN